MTNDEAQQGYDEMLDYLDDWGKQHKGQGTAKRLAGEIHAMLEHIVATVGISAGLRVEHAPLFVEVAGEAARYIAFRIEDSAELDTASDNA
jgi:hypothetical protein